MPRLRVTFRAMAAENAMTVDYDDERHARQAIDAAIADVQRIEAKYSRYRDDSVTSGINRAAGGEPVLVDAETAALLDYADRLHSLSRGRFDITSGVLRRAWDFKRKPARLPDANAIADLLAIVGWQHVSRDADHVRLALHGMQLDFGGIGKEYAADRAAAILAQHGIRHALVNLAGDVRAVNDQADGAPWRVGVQHPRRAEGEAIAFVELRDNAIATSGDYERFFEIDGRRYCHVIDARTGMPVSAWQSVSVIAPLATVAGTCATIAMLMEEEAAAFLARQEVAWLGVDASGELRR
ncbi:MAG TPA: FAD:protein FMN transferase [Casimicrobiaceae bacterium]|nr:FAD:protein FMN transferase [Casimicrobiaceae bacterium]